MQLLLELQNILERYGDADWVILPATMDLYNRRTVDIITAVSEWDGGIILICKKGSRTCFVSSSGTDEKSYNYYAKDIGKTFSTQHDQTGASKGDYKLINVVLIKGKEIVKQANDEGIKEKASLAVFK